MERIVSEVATEQEDLLKTHQDAYAGLLAKEAEPEAKAQPEAAAEEQPEKGEAEGETSEATETTEATAEATEQEAEGQPAETKPGTPDKALQKMQQDLSAAQRKLDDVLAKFEAGESLTDKEQQQAAQAKRKIDQIREKLAGNAFDLIDDAPALAESTLELDQTVQGLNQKVQQLESELHETRAERTWGKMQQLYPGVSVQDVWSKCLSEAAETIGPENPALGALANKLFHDRAGNAAKSIAATKQQQQSKTNKKVPAAPAAPTPGTKVQVDRGIAAEQAPSVEEVAMRGYRGLIAAGNTDD